MTLCYSLSLRKIDVVDIRPRFIAILSEYEINSLLKKIGAKAGVTGVHAHRYRRTCATMALRNGMPVEMVSKMLGHEDIKTTQIYLDLCDRDLKRLHERYVD